MRILNSKPLLLMCLLLFFVVGIGTKTLADKMTDDAELPIKKILIEVKKSQRDVFFDEKVGSDESFYNQIEVERDCCFS